MKNKLSASKLKMELPYITEKELTASLKSNDLFTKTVRKALQQAKKSHKGQKRFDGKPYLEEHIYPVVAELIDLYKKRKIPEELIVSAILHDAMEDDVSFTEKKCRRTFSDRVFEILKPLTKTEEDNIDTLSEKQKMMINKKYLGKIKKASKYSKLVKLSDRYNNVSCMMQLRGTPKYVRYTKETKKFFLPFAKKTSKYFYARIKTKLDELEKI